MRNRRQHLKSWLGLSIAASNYPSIAYAALPDKPIKLIVPSAAGGSPDVVCRILAAELAKALGQPVIVDNKPGAGGAIGIQEVARATADGTTLGYGNVVTLAINQSLYSKLTYDADTQLTGIAHLGDVQNVLIVNNALPVKSVADLIAYAKSRPGKLSMGSAGNGTTGHLGGELFKALTGTYVTHVPYRGSPQAINDLIGGQIEMMFDNLTSALPHVKAGRVRALGVSGGKRSPLAPDLPTIEQAGVKGYETTAWGGIVAPAGTPKDIVQKLNAEINKILALPNIMERYAQLGFEVNTGSTEKLFDRAKKERPQWAQIVKRSGAKVD
jgi:tripartite-type tricarboxylate transporter receptor subunit TctC